MTQNKIQQSSPIYSDQQQHHHRDGKMFESVLFEGMTEVNSKLISLGNNFKLVDNLYFMNNNNMIDEFIENMKQFMKQLENQRNKVAFGKLNSDILSHVYQFLDTKTLKNCCGLVCKLWKESLIGLKVKVKTENVTNFLNSSLVNHVTELNFSTNIAQSFKSLSNCTNLNQLKAFEIQSRDFDSESIEYLMKCKMPNLTEFKFKLSHLTTWSNTKEGCLIELFNNNFMSSIKKLDLSYAIQDFPNNFYESVSESKYLNQITHLKISNSGLQFSKRIDLFLKTKVNLEHLELSKYELTLCPNLLTNGNYKNLKYLNISYCQIKNQEFVNLFISPNLPNLETIKADSWVDEIDNTVAAFPSNSQSSITELAFTRFKPELFPSLLDHCPKLKKLTIQPTLNGFSEEEPFTQMIKSPGLSNLEFLHIMNNEIVEDIFINPIYSNLKELYFVYGEINMDNVKSLSNCTNLVNLTLLDLSDATVSDKTTLEEYSKAFNNPTFSKLKINLFPTVYYNETDVDDELSN